MRIVSLIPSITETLFNIGLGENVVGITDFCIYPSKETRKKPKVGGTKTPNAKKIIKLRPDIVLGNNEENSAEVLKYLEKEKILIWRIQPKSIADVLDILRKMPDRLGAPNTPGRSRANVEKIVYQIKESYKFCQTHIPLRPPRVVCLVWKNPYIAVGAGTYIHHLIEASGAENIYWGKENYPKTSLGEISSLKPDIALLPSEPYRFSSADAKEISRATRAKAILVAGEDICWYGARSARGLRKLFKIFQPDICWGAPS